jgi:hypothetical protein
MEAGPGSSNNRSLNNKIFETAGSSIMTHLSGITSAIRS